MIIRETWLYFLLLQMDSLKVISWNVRGIANREKTARQAYTTNGGKATDISAPL